MQPQPRVNTKSSFPNITNTARERATLSEDGHYLVTLLFNNPGNNTLILYDVEARQELFRVSGDILEYTLDADGSLIYVVAPDPMQDVPPLRGQLFRWDAKSRETHLSREYKVPEAGEIFKLDYSFHIRPNSTFDRWSRLSPNGRTWIILCSNEENAWYELIDVRSGERRARLSLPLMPINSFTSKACGMCFIEGGEVVLVQTEVVNVKSHSYQLLWIDIKTGHELHSTPLPAKVDEIIYATNELVVGKADKPEGEGQEEVFVFSGPTRSLRKIVLTEIKPELQQRPAEYKTKEISPRASVDLYVDKVSQTLIAGWSYYFVWPPRQFCISVPDFHYCVYDLTTGNMLQCNRIDLQQSQKQLEGSIRGDASFYGVLPGPIIVLSKGRSPPEGIAQEWLDQVQRFLNLSQQGLTLYFHEAANGKTLCALHISGSNWKPSISADNKSMTLIGWNGETITYDYPLHKPWLLIWSWALGVAATITVLVEASRWVRRRKA